MDRFPFSAVVGAHDLGLALLLSAVSPGVGGVLVRGEKGTAKSTMVRALADLLPPVPVVAGCRFSCDPAAPDPGCPDGPHPPGAPGPERPARLVELPVGAAEERVTGALHLERALAAGVAEYEPGLLAAAHRGLLYVDEVNLLPDHLVDLLLDAAAMGRCTVEREGVSVSHAARFVLVGTMNPEEGELRPQLLDRFGLSVEVAASREPAERVEVVRRRLAYEADPAGFAARYDAADRALSERILKARAALPSVVLGDAALTAIAEVCAAFEVDGLRADIVTARAAVAHAAWCARSEVTRDDVRAAARLALGHRRRRSPFDEPGLDEELLDRVLGAPEEDPEDPDDDPAGPDGGPGGGSGGGPGTPPAAGPEPDEAPDAAPAEPWPAGPGGSEPGQPAAAPRGTVADAGQAYRTRLLQVPGAGRGEAGRRSPARTRAGRTVGSRPAGPANRGAPVHLPATLRTAAVAGGPAARRVAVRPEHLRVAVREGRESNLVLLCVDASGSMAARRRMEQVKTAVLSLLLDAYRRRDRVGLVTFAGHEATLVLPPTGSVDVAAARLRALPAGGRTPLAEGLLRSAEVLRTERLRDPRRRPLLVVVTDGRATAGPDALARSRRVAAGLAGAVAAVVVDCETGPMRLGLARDLAGHLGAEHVPVGEVSAEQLTAQVRRRAA